MNVKGESNILFLLELQLWRHLKVIRESKIRGHRGSLKCEFSTYDSTVLLSSPNWNLIS